jgi:hypothetical protein
METKLNTSIKAIFDGNLAMWLDQINLFPKNFKDALLDYAEGNDLSLHRVLRSFGVMLEYGSSDDEDWWDDIEKARNDKDRFVYYINIMDHEFMLNMTKTTKPLFDAILKAYDIEFKGFEVL